jgi:hypothetical protein
LRGGAGHVTLGIMQKVRAALSLGPNCRGKFHLHRVFGDANPNGVFDWQVTPTEAIHRYLAQDFEGMFERSDLLVKAGVVWNGRHNSSHQHEFPRGLSEDQLDACYPAARARHDHLCNRTRGLLHGRGPLLLVFSRPAPVEVIDALKRRVSTYNPRLTFHLVGEPPAGAVGDWTGDTAVWDELLSPFAIDRLHGLMAGVRATWRKRFRRRRPTAAGDAPTLPYPRE